MSEALNPKEIAMAAAQGVAIALNARKPKTGGNIEEFYTLPHRIVCGIPPILFEATLLDDGRGSYSIGGLINKTGPDAGDPGEA
jgi:hypothetical protein